MQKNAVVSNAELRPSSEQASLTKTALLWQSLQYSSRNIRILLYNYIKVCNHCCTQGYITGSWPVANRATLSQVWQVLFLFLLSRSWPLPLLFIPPVGPPRGGHGGVWCHQWPIIWQLCQVAGESEGTETHSRASPARYSKLHVYTCIQKTLHVLYQYMYYT